MMLRIAEAPTWDTKNEGKTLTPYWAAELLGIDMDLFLRAQAGTTFHIGGYTLEAVRRHVSTLRHDE
jgi:hypothetical protein